MNVERNDVREARRVRRIKRRRQFPKTPKEKRTPRQFSVSEPIQPSDRLAGIASRPEVVAKGIELFSTLQAGRNLRSRIKAALKANRKSQAYQTLIGCTPGELRKHLQRQFSEGMSWTNYGTWHIDHIRPCCSFDLSKPDQQAECFHYSNLQPLWAADNLTKGGSYVEPEMQRADERRAQPKEKAPRLVPSLGSWHDRIRFAYNFGQQRPQSVTNSALITESVSGD